jgi:hypothetical protein
MDRYIRWWSARLDGRPLSIFRMGFGVFLVLDALYFRGFLNFYWPERAYHFQFPLFSAWPQFDNKVNATLLTLQALGGGFIAIGLFTRTASAFVGLVTFHFLVLEASFYLNHLALNLFIATAFIFIPTDRFYALKKSQSKANDGTIARYELFAVIAFFWMSYSFSAIEKMRIEWINGDIIFANMGMSRGMSFMARLLYQSNFLSAQAWAVLSTEFFAPLLLLYKPTKVPMILFLTCFHIVNFFTLDIGLFSLLMLFSLVLYWKLDPVKERQF